MSLLQEEREGESIELLVSFVIILLLFFYTFFFFRKKVWEIVEKWPGNESILVPEKMGSVSKRETSETLFFPTVSSCFIASLNSNPFKSMVYYFFFPYFVGLIQFSVTDGIFRELIE